MNNVVEGELYRLQKMITSLVEILEEKGILTQEEGKARIRKKIEEGKGLIKLKTTFHLKILILKLFCLTI